MVNRVPGIGAGFIPPSRPRNSATGGFAVENDTQTEPARPSLAPQSVTLSAMLALQETETTGLRDKTARRHGLALLEALCSLQKSLLTSSGDAETSLTSLADLITQIPEAADPGLAAILAEVSLRAKIELIRRGLEIP